MQHLIRKILPRLDHRLHRCLQHRTENDLQTPHQAIDRKFGRIHKTLQCNGFQTLLDNPETGQTPAHGPDLFQVALRQLLLRNYLDCIVPCQIVRSYDSSEKVWSITNIRVNDITKVLTFTSKTWIDSYSTIRLSSESNNVPLFETNLFNPVLRQRYDESGVADFLDLTSFHHLRQAPVPLYIIDLLGRI